MEIFPSDSPPMLALGYMTFIYINVFDETTVTLHEENLHVENLELMATVVHTEYPIDETDSKKQENIGNRKKITGFSFFSSCHCPVHTIKALQRLNL